MKPFLFWTTIAVLALASSASAAEKLDAVALARRIDREIQQRLDAEKLQPAALADDAEFLRRAYLDITGAIPPYEETVTFLDSTDPDKRAKLVEGLLASPQHARYLAGIWASKLIPRELASVGMNRNTMVEKLGGWFDGALAKNMPWDQLVRELITAKGVPNENGAAMLFANPDVDKLTDIVGRMFLGVQLQCAQCHDDRLGRPWQRTDYWGLAAFFFKVRENRMRLEEAAKLNLERGITEQDAPRLGKRKLPATAKEVSPKFLAAEAPSLDPAAAFRPALADWMTAPANPYFARALVNRQWAHLFGRGLVNPIDDLHEKNEPSHPKLLLALTEQFVVNGYDVQYLFRAICLSEAYQRTSTIPRAGSVSDRSAHDQVTELFGRMAVKDLRPRQLANCREVLVPKKMGNGPKPLYYADLIDDVDATAFGKGIPDTLALLNARDSGTFLKDLAGRLVPTKNDRSVEENLAIVYLHMVSRRPTAEETRRLAAYVDRQGARGYQDICWALLNSAEFLLNH